MKVGERLRELREAARLSQAELGRRVGVAGPTISRYETGAAKIDADFIPRLANALGVDPSDFFPETRRAGRPPSSPGATLRMADLVITVIAHRWQRLPEKDRLHILQLLGLVSMEE